MNLFNQYILENFVTRNSERTVTMMQFEYTRKPSIATLRAAAFRAVNAGETWIQFTWGENQITLEKSAWGWDGHGWIGRNGGSDLAREITRAGKGAA